MFVPKMPGLSASREEVRKQYSTSLRMGMLFTRSKGEGCLENNPLTAVLPGAQVSEGDYLGIDIPI
jgi:hypothetical protein